MTFECLLLLATLCHAIKDRPVVALTAAQASVSLADGFTTRELTDIGYEESNPLVRRVCGVTPGWGCMAPAGAGITIGEMWLAERMKTSRRKWVRKLWWLPQTVTIGANTYGLRNNVRAIRAGG